MAAAHTSVWIGELEGYVDLWPYYYRRKKVSLCPSELTGSREDLHLLSLLRTRLRLRLHRCGREEKKNRRRKWRRVSQLLKTPSGVSSSCRGTPRPRADVRVIIFASWQLIFFPSVIIIFLLFFFLPATNWKQIMLLRLGIRPSKSSLCVFSFPFTYL